MVIVMVPFSKGNERDEIVINSGMLLAKGLRSPSMGNGVNKPGKVMEEKETNSPCNNKGSKVVIEYVAHRKCYKDIGNHHKQAIILVLKHDKLISIEIGNDFLIKRLCFSEKPKHMGMHKTFFD